MLSRVNVEEGLQMILERLKRVEKEEIPAAEACGRILAQNLISPENIPPFRRSPLDGYAFRAEDTKDASEENPVILEILEEIPAGKAPEHSWVPCRLLKFSRVRPFQKVRMPLKSLRWYRLMSIPFIFFVLIKKDAMWYLLEKILKKEIRCCRMAQ